MQLTTDERQLLFRHFRTCGIAEDIIPIFLFCIEDSSMPGSHSTFSEHIRNETHYYAERRGWKWDGEKFAKDGIPMDGGTYLGLQDTVLKSFVNNRVQMPPHLRDVLKYTGWSY